MIGVRKLGSAIARTITGEGNWGWGWGRMGAGERRRSPAPARGPTLTPKNAANEAIRATTGNGGLINARGGMFCREVEAGLDEAGDPASEWRYRKSKKVKVGAMVE